MVAPRREVIPPLENLAALDPGRIVRSRKAENPSTFRWGCRWAIVGSGRNSAVKQVDGGLAGAHKALRARTLATGAGMMRIVMVRRTKGASVFMKRLLFEFAVRALDFVKKGANVVRGADGESAWEAWVLGRSVVMDSVWMKTAMATLISRTLSVDVLTAGIGCCVIYPERREIACWEYECARVGYWGLARHVLSLLKRFVAFLEWTHSGSQLEMRIAMER